MIDFFDISRQYDSLKDEVEQAVLRVMRSGHYIGGKAIRDFEEAAAGYLGVKYAVTCNSGTDALRIALRAAGVGMGDEVITTPFSFYATAEAISQVGAVPVFADIKECGLNIDPSQIEKKITEKTKAILPVHIFGLPADMDEINETAERNGIRVIEDACQAIGASYHDRKAGSLADMGCFSFYPTKNLGAFGDGGMITTDDDNLAVAIKALKNHGAGRDGANAWAYLTGESTDELEGLNASANGLYDPCKYYNYLVGDNSRLDAVQAAVLNIKIKRLDDFNARRSTIADKYSKAFSNLPIIIPQTGFDDRISCWHQYAILTNDKDELVRYLGENGVGTGAFYPIPLHLQRVFKYLGYKEGDLPVAENVCKRSVCLPVFPELKDNELETIIKLIKSFYSETI